MIEDALGLKIYQWKKNESLKKLEKTEENMKQVESLRREIAPHLKFLKKQVEKVEKAEEMRKELSLLYQQYFACEQNYLNQEKSRIESELNLPKKEMEQMDTDLALAKNILNNSQSKDHKSDELLGLETELKVVRDNKDNIVRDLGRVDGEIGANLRTIEKERARQKQEEFQTVYLKDVESIAKKIESYSSISDVGELFREVIKTIRDFISGHRTKTDSALIGEAEQEIEKLKKQKVDFDQRIVDLRKKEQDLIANYNSLREKIEKEKDTNRETEKNIFKIIARQNEVRSVISFLNQQMEIVTRRDMAFKQELGQAGILVGREATEFKDFLDKEKNYVLQDDRKRSIEKMKIRLEDFGGNQSTEILKEYRETEERDTFLEKELADLGKAKDELINLIKDLDIRIDTEFRSGILKINSEFNKYFTLMFGGGKAELELIKEVKKKKVSGGEELDQLLGGEEVQNQEEEDDGLFGLDVNVSLPKKRVKGLMMLSGGERALTSIALLFAISQVNPPPFIILDETDAALDEANSKKYGDMIEDLSKRSQLILITHNRETMSRAGAIYGVTMGADGASRLLSIAFEDAVAVAK
jgi:chromosome segregation protein